ncbi:transcription factor Vhr1-domain-containing protein [Kockiozyma suomiensis]|uniref:transcription factor Vhr1-domain-containing protein n=1 Tax=Kockiozyma suomiensis TaxID=1337062 RepID=UPI0033430B6B
MMAEVFRTSPAASFSSAAAPRTAPLHTIRIDCAGSSILWRLEDDSLSFARLHSYVQSAFFIDHLRYIVLRARPLHCSSTAVPLFISDDASLRQALTSDDIVIDVLLSPDHTAPQLLPQSHMLPQLQQQGLAAWQMIPSAISNYAEAASASSAATSAPVLSRPSLPPMSSIHHSSPDTPTSPLSPPRSGHGSHHAHHRRESSIYIPPAKATSTYRVSGVTQTIRQKLNFVDEGQWKKFSARRLELIDSMALSTKKASEQDDVIIAVADNLREEYGFPPDTLQDFDKLVRAAVQSVRRNRKRLPKSKVRSKSLSVERDVSLPPQAATSNAHVIPIDGRQFSASQPWAVSPRSSLTAGVDTLSVNASSSSSEGPASYFNHHTSLVGRLSESSIPQVRPPAIRSPTSSSISSVSTYSSYLSASAEDSESSGSQTPLDSYAISSSSQSTSCLPRTLPSPKLSSSCLKSSNSMSASVSPAPSVTGEQESSISLSLSYSDNTFPCIISKAELNASALNCLPFILRIVRRTLSLSENSLVALYYTRRTDGVRIQITSDADAEWLLRTPQDSAPLRIEVLAMEAQSSLAGQPASSVALLGGNLNVPAVVSSSPESTAPRTRRISIGALVMT